MSAPQIIERQHTEGDSGLGSHWAVTVFDNPVNTFDEVIMILMAATRCTQAEAEMETWEVHHLGRSVVHHGREDECRKAAAVIARIGIRVEVSRE